MTIETFVTYTQYCPKWQAHVEHTTSLLRPYSLTSAGAQRIIRRDYPTAIVTRIQHYITRA